MGLTDIASRIDETLEKAGEAAEEQQARIVEHDANKMAHHITAYVLERGEPGLDPVELGVSMVQGACIGEDETDGFLAEPVVQFLESLLEGAKKALAERQGAESLYLDPVDHCVQYMLAHSRWPESASATVISKAKAALATGRSGSGGDNSAAHGTYL